MLDLFKKNKTEEVTEISLDRALRPRNFAEYIGQKDLINKIKISIEASNNRNEALDHILLSGSPGLGKTTIASVIAAECKADFRSIVATSIRCTSDVIEILSKLKPRSILFLDEIHALDKKTEETLYSSLEDFQLDIKLGNKEIVKIRLNPFCLIGATTVPGKMSAPLRDRFGTSYTMQFYSDEELATIVMANACKLGLHRIETAAIEDIARRSRGTPRIANRLLRRARDFVQVKNGNVLSCDAVVAAFELEGIDKYGFTDLDRKYLDTIYRVFNAGPCGLDAISASIGEDKTTIEHYTEPFLVRSGLIARTRTGRMLTGEGMSYILELEKGKT